MVSSETAHAALPDHGLVVLDGPDALAFAQAQLANDVAALPDGHWHFGSLLTPQGRVLALMLCVRRSADRIELVVPRGRAAAIGDALRRFVFRRKLVVSVEQAVFAAEFGPEQPLCTEGAIETGASGWCLTLGGSAGRRLHRRDAARPEDASAESRWREADLEDALPFVSDPTVDLFLPHALGLARIGAFSVRKGCYPGQEIVARTHFLGRNKRRLVRFRVPGPLAPPLPGTRLVTEPVEGGATVVDAIARPGCIQGLAVVHESATALIPSEGMAAVSVEPVDPA